MTDDERVIWENLLDPCRSCYGSPYAGSTFTASMMQMIAENPPLPNEVVGIRMNRSQSYCGYCTRLDNLIATTNGSGIWIPEPSESPANENKNG